MAEGPRESFTLAPPAHGIARQLVVPGRAVCAVVRVVPGPAEGAGAGMLIEEQGGKSLKHSEHE